MRTATTARERAIANENRQIEESQSRAIAARESEQRKPRNALEALSSRLEVSPEALRTSLMKTVFSACRNEAEFIALVVVANAYGLNPLTKEIYAFPSKGGGVTPMISIDGWIKVMNSHPQFDGIEFEYTINDKGKVEAIESIIYRKDRSHPIKTIEFMEECKRNTEPWNKMERRMLRNRALIQGVRIAFGVEAYAEEDEVTIEGNWQAVEPAKSLPNRQSLAEELNDEIPSFDQDTGEVYERDSRGFTEVDEEVARELDAGNDGTLAEDNPTAEEGPAQEQRGEPEPDAEAPWLKMVRGIRGSIAAANNETALKAIEKDWLNRIRPQVEEINVIRSVEADIAAKRNSLKVK